MFSTEIKKKCLYAWLDLFFPLFMLEKKMKGGKKGYPKARELNQNSSLFETSSTCRLYNFWQTPYFKNSGSTLLFSQVTKSHQSSCAAQSGALLTFTPRAQLAATAIRWVSPSPPLCARAYQIFYVKCCITYNTAKNVSGFTALFKAKSYLQFLKENSIFEEGYLVHYIWRPGR